MNNPFDSLFGRLAMMTVGLIVVSVLTLMVMVDRDRGKVDVQHIARGALAAMALRDHAPQAAAGMATQLGVSYIGLDQLAASGCTDGCPDSDGMIERHLRPLLPPGTHIAFNDGSTLWVRAEGTDYAVKIEHVLVPLHRFVSAVGVILGFAVIFAVIFAWQLQQPVHELAKASRAYRRGRLFQPLPRRGPRELRALTGDFNDMVSELMEADRERAIMMASIAHDLRSPVTRMLVRADMMDNDKDRAGFLRDTESMSRIIAQFLDFAGSPAGSAMVSVDAYCRRHYTDAMSSADEQDALVTLQLDAGAGFQLPEVDLDRILSNVIENSMAYGAPPVALTTQLRHGRYMLQIRDHGPGVPEDKLDHIMRPFVRLDEARQGHAHSGLGLAIVKRIVRHHGGTTVVTNAGGAGGLLISLSFPVRAIVPM